VCHYDRISREILPGMITLNTVRGLRPLKEDEENHKQPEDAPALNEKDMVKMMDVIDSYLCLTHICVAL
jgi:hypothetical protein